MKIITLDGLKTFLDELLEKIGQEVYSKVESDARFATKDALAGKQDKIKNLTFTEGMDSQLRRPYVGIETTHPIVRFNRPLSVNGQLIPNNAEVESTVKIIGGDLFQPKGDYATKADLAQLGGGVPRGTWFAPMGPSAWEVPRGVEVVKITWAGKDTYFKVKQGGVIRAMIMSDVLSGGLGDSWIAQRLKFYRASGTVTDMKDHIPNFSEMSQTEFAISWSPEINAHAVNVDLAK